METSVDRFGRIVIPKRIRENFGIQPGTEIRIEEDEDVIILSLIHEKASLRVKDGVLVFSGIPQGDLTDSLTRHRKERIESVRK